MKREKMLDEMVKYFNTIPTWASSYHKMDCVLRMAEKLGMQPPAVETKTLDGKICYYFEWEDEEDQDE